MDESDLLQIHHVYKNLLEPKDWNPLEVGTKSPLKLLSLTTFCLKLSLKIYVKNIKKGVVTLISF